MSRCEKACLKCSSIGCELCIQGYFLDNNTCQPCSKSNQFVNSNNKCVDCSQGCSSCSKSDVCFKCFPGFKLDNKSQQCVPCKENCVFCYGDDLCTVCKNNYTKNQKNGKCELIKMNEKIIYSAIRKSKINSILLSPISQDETIQKDQIFNFQLFEIKNCKISDSFGNCILCNVDFYLKHEKCQPCSEGCLKCQNDQNCLICNSNFKMQIHEKNSICIETNVNHCIFESIEKK